jgi:hypothetical protein
LPDEPRGEADQQGLGERLVAPKLIFEQGSDDPGEDPHWDGGGCPHPEDLSERVLPDALVPISACIGTGNWLRLGSLREDALTSSNRPTLSSMGASGNRSRPIARA